MQGPIRRRNAQKTNLQLWGWNGAKLTQPAPMLPNTYAALQQPFFSRIRTTTTPCTKTHPDTSKYDSGPSPNQHRITLATVAYARPSPGVCAAFGAGRKRYVETSPSRVRWRDATMDANQSQKIVCGCECEVTL